MSRIEEINHRMFEIECLLDELNYMYSELEEELLSLEDVAEQDYR